MKKLKMKNNVYINSIIESMVNRQYVFNKIKNLLIEFLEDEIKLSQNDETKKDFKKLKNEIKKINIDNAETNKFLSLLINIIEGYKVFGKLLTERIKELKNE
jgi:hypothetical protein